MGASKVQNEQEIQRWFEEGKTYAWMAEEYGRKYNIQIAPTAFANLRRRRGWDRRITRDDELIPWAVKDEHRWAYPVVMLRVEARRRAGRPLREQDAVRIDPWKAELVQRGVVVHYDPETEDGFFYVPARPGVDLDLIREPDARAARGNRAAD